MPREASINSSLRRSSRFQSSGQARCRFGSRSYRAGTWPCRAHADGAAKLLCDPPPCPCSSTRASVELPAHPFGAVNPGLRRGADLPFRPPPGPAVPGPLERPRAAASGRAGMDGAGGSGPAHQRADHLRLPVLFGAGDPSTVLVDDSLYTDSSAGGAPLVAWLEDTISRRFLSGGGRRNVSCFPAWAPDGLSREHCGGPYGVPGGCRRPPGAFSRPGRRPGRRGRCPCPRPAARWPWAGRLFLPSRGAR